MFFVSPGGDTKQMWAGVADHREGVGFFSDPIAKPSLFTYWRTLSESAYSTLLLRYKRPTEEGFAAASNSPSPAWDADGVVVSRGLVLYGAVRCGEVRCDAVRCDVMRCNDGRCDRMRVMRYGSVW